MEQQQLDKIARDIYEETRARYTDPADIACCPELCEEDFGYRILYGPPVLNSKVLFLGYQPGVGKVPETLAEYHSHWPKECEYAVKEWKLARRLRDIFGQDFLKKTVGLNLYFFRSPSIKRWETNVPKDLRLELEQYCAQKCKQLVKAINPEVIIIIGLSTFKRIADTQWGIACRKSKQSNHSLALKGTLWGKKLLA